MNAAVYHGKRDVRIQDRPAPTPRPGELLLRVAAAGICGTDAREYALGPHEFPLDAPHPFSGHGGPMIPGHEFSGHVVSWGEGVSGFGEGDLVAAGAGVSCGRCGPCGRGVTNLCERYWTVGLQRDGGLAELVAVPAAACLNVSSQRAAVGGLTGDLAALCQPMSIALHAVRRGRPERGQPVTVFGAGGIGTFVTYALAQLGAEVTVVDSDPDRLTVASALGAGQTVAVQRGTPLVDRLGEVLGRPRLVVECTGAPEPLQAALTLSARGGRVVVVGHQPAPVATDFQLVSYGEREVVGTVAHVFARDFADAAELVAREPGHWANIAPVVQPLDALLRAGLDPLAAHRPVQMKALFDPRIAGPRPLRTQPT